jgi:hypothetical protein
MLCSTKVSAREACGLLNAREHQCFIRTDTLARGLRLVVDLPSETWLTPASDQDACTCLGSCEWQQTFLPWISFSLSEGLASSPD